jgi:DNA replication protein DnaC
VHIDRAPIKDLSPSVLAVLRRYIAELPARVEAGEGLWFYGPAGTGKTSAAMLVAKKGIECGIASAIYSAPQLLATLRSTFDDRNEQTHLGLVDRLSEVDLLQIDDLGAEKTSPWVLEQLYAIVNARYENRRATVITTNLERSMLAEQIGGRTVSRLEEMCEVLPVLGPDLRRRFGEAKPLLNYQMPEEGPRAA